MSVNVPETILMRSITHQTSSPPPVKMSRTAVPFFQT